MIKKPIKLDELSTAVQVPGADIPKPAVGREYTYSFWVYVDNYNQTVDNNKLLFYRGAKDNINTANPVVMMDSVENRLYFAIKTENTALNIGSNSDLRNIISKNYFKTKTTSLAESNKYVIMEVDYVPVQRWVNVICIVDNKIITLFMDGEIYSVKTIDELKALRKPELDGDGKPKNYNLIVDKTEGDVFIGKNIINNNITLNGYFSKLEFLNYAINLNQVKAIYNKGPISRGLGTGSKNVYTGVDSGTCGM